MFRERVPFPGFQVGTRAKIGVSYWRAAFRLCGTWGRRLEWRLMETREMRSWEEFEETFRKLESERADLESGRSPFYVSPFLFRGQSSSTWKLETTLERYLPNAVRPRVRGYYRKMFAAKPQIEAGTEHRWEIPTLEEFSTVLEAQESPTLPGLPGYEFWVYLRHLRFPSPLLDWSRSPYVAAFFAFNGAGNQPHPPEAVAIFAYLEYAGRAKRHNPRAPYIATTGPYVRSHMRHVLQQSDYSICLVRDNDEWRFESHESALSASGQQESLWKFTIPAAERAKVLCMLDRFNLNAFSLFGSDEGLVESVANRELMFKGEDL